MWTLKGQIQEFIDVYVSQATYTEVVRSFPYMVSKEFASGGGDVREPQQPGHQAPYPSRSQIPEFKWHIFEDKVSIDVADSGILITPFEGGTVYYLTGFRLLRFSSECSATWARMVNKSTAWVCSDTINTTIDAHAAFDTES